MKTITIVGAKNVKITESLLNQANKDVVIEGQEDMSIFDGYHTFDELYDHRVTLFIALCRLMRRWEHALNCYSDVWRSKKHHDGTMFDGCFIMGFRTQPGEQITYHLPLERWKETEFARTEEAAPQWDGHIPADVLERLKKL